MNTLTWIVSVVAYFVFNYAFALLNLWVWKKRVRIEKVYEKRYGEPYEIEVVRMSRFVAILWPSYLHLTMPESKEDVRANSFLINDSEDKGGYLLLMTVAGSTIEVMHLVIFWLYMAPIVIALPFLLGKLFRFGLEIVTRLPGAKKVL
ncbi:hypothetical protein EPO05_01155 [Patescibacteria group bacterium]|nr:MAG: hypothetical protein EPO05_01155 [Patescibacteria group bacterium]